MRTILLLAAACVVSLAAVADGKRIFEFACARCHGSDGNSTTYPGVRPLGGIGERLSRAELAERLHPLPLGNGQVTVRSHVLALADFEALVRFVADLPTACDQSPTSRIQSVSRQPKNSAPQQR